MGKDGAIAQSSAKRVGRPFEKGKSGNPGGLPKGLGEFRALCRSHAPEAVATLVAALGDPDACVQASRVLLEYSWPKPAQALDIGTRPEFGGIQIIFAPKE